MFPAMNGGNVMSPRTLYPRFGEAAGKVSGVDWLFALDEADPWVKTYVVSHRPSTATRLRRFVPPFPTAGEQIPAW